MIGLSFLAAFMVYLFISAFVIYLASKRAKKKGRSPLKWGLIAAIVMYHLVFWDFIPTMIVYKYDCTTKAGFWVYKTPEQWKVENPGVAETLTWRESSPDYKVSEVTRGYQLNERMAWIVKEKNNFIVPVICFEELIVDVKNDEILIRQVNVRAGYIRGKGFIKFWTNWPNYMPNYKEFGQYIITYKRLGSKIE